MLKLVDKKNKKESFTIKKARVSEQARVFDISF